MIENRAPTLCWCLRRDQLYPITSTGVDDTICIQGVGDQYLELSRKDARLLAKRINQCLDATAKR